MNNKTRIRTLFLTFISLSFLCFISYLNSLNNPFIWDDQALIEKNALIRNWHLWPQAFVNDLYYHITSGSNFYRPFQTLSYMWDYHFWQLDPFGYHLTNIILQVLVSFLVFLLVLRLYKVYPIALSTSLLFALCPLAVESVTYISGRAELLMGSSLITALLLFIHSDGKNGPGRIIYLCFSVFFFILGLMSKELSVVFPFIIAAYAYYFKRDKLNFKYFINSVLIFFVIDLLYLTLRLSFLNFSTYRPPALSQYPLLIRLMVFPKVTFTYLKLLILPVDLHMSRTLVRPSTFSGIFLAWFALGVILVYMWRNLLGKHKGIYPFMLFWALAFLFPQSGIIPINAFISDHFIYLSSISFFLLISILMSKYLKKTIFALSVAGLIIFYGSLTATRNFDWKDPVIFYQKLVQLSPDSFQGHNNLGLQYEYRKLYEQAIKEYNKALEISPNLLEAHSNLANLYFKMNKLDEAKKEYNIIEKIAPKSKAGEIQNNIGCVLEAEGKFDEALKRYKAALRIDPSLIFTHFNIAKITLNMGDLDGASEELLKSLPELNSENEKVNYIKIIKEFLATRRGRWDSAVFYNDLGVKFAHDDLMPEAGVAFSRAIELQPFYADAHYNLGLTFLRRGLKREAASELKKANQLVETNPKPSK